MKEKKSLKKSEEVKFNPRNNAGNAGVRAESIRKILGAIPGCGQNKSELARRADVSDVVVRRVLHEKRPENAEVQAAFAAEPRVAPWEIKRAVKIANLKECIPKCGGNKYVLAEMMGCSPESIWAMINDKREPVLKKMFDAAKKESSPLKDIGKRGGSELDKFFGKSNPTKEDKDETNYNLEFDIDEERENFLPHQVSFAYAAPDEVKHPALIGGFGCGKTMSIPLRWLKLIEFRKSQGKSCELMVIEPTTEMIQDILVPAFDEFFGRFGVPVKYIGWKKSYSIYYKGEKHTCIFRSGERPRALTGKNLTDVIIDEFERMPYSKQKQTWRECISRIRRAPHGTCAVVSTPEGFKLVHELWNEL